MAGKIEQAEWRADCLKARMDALKADADPCWEGYEQRGTKEKGGETVPNCVEADSVATDGKSALRQINELMSLLDEREDQSSRNNGYRQHRTDIQRWVKAVKAAGLEVPNKLQNFKNFWQ